MLSSPRIVIREITCRTILNRGGPDAYSLNCYVGCSHGCAYCYARFIQRFHPHEEPWGTFVDIKLNAVEALKRQLRRLPPGEVFVSSACDGWQPLEAQCRLTFRCCQLLLEYGFSLNILTKSALLERDLPEFSGKAVQVGVTLTTLDEQLRRLWEPGAASVKERLKLLESARRHGLATSAMLGPLLPRLSDSPASITALLSAVCDMGVGRIWVDALNPRPRVWPAVAALLRRCFPELLAEYRRLLFYKPSRAEYLGVLRERVAESARRLGLTNSVACCM